MDATENLLDLIESRVVTPRPDCMIWAGATDRGYGRVFVEGRSARVHRVAWELVNGPIPDGLTVDHLCRVRSCCNTDHMELVSGAENSRRAWAYRVPKEPKPKRKTSSPVAQQVVPLTCKRGHLRTFANLMFRPSGTVECRVCAVQLKRARRAEARATGRRVA